MTHDVAKMAVRARQLAQEIGDATDLLNGKLREVEVVQQCRAISPCQLTVSYEVAVRGPKAGKRSAVLGWDGNRLTWDGRPLLTCSRAARMVACDHLEALFLWGRVA